MPTKADLEKQLKVAEARILELEEELEACKFDGGGGAPVPKRGILYLWQDRALTAWGGTKLSCMLSQVTYVRTPFVTVWDFLK
jgi:hypothetical protein